MIYLKNLSDFYLFDVEQDHFVEHGFFNFFFFCKCKVYFFLYVTI